MVNRTCDEPACENPHLARGMCRRHYGSWYKAFHEAGPRGPRDRQAEYYDRQCVVCATGYRSSRPTGKYCSNACRSVDYRSRNIGPPGRKSRTCHLPADHPVRALIAEAQAEAKRQAEQRRLEVVEVWPKPWMTARHCPECDAYFTPLLTSTTIHCTKRCNKRAARRRRRARENHAVNMWTWSEFNKIILKFGHRCAYCGDEPADQMEADHVVPLSRGGSDALSNLLPACKPCNGSKSARSLDEWRQWRADRGLPMRTTTWQSTDQRFTHLAVAPAAPLLLAAA